MMLRFAVSLQDVYSVNVEDRKGELSGHFLWQGFVYGQILYKEITAKMPKYVHLLVWKLHRQVQQWSLEQHEGHRRAQATTDES